MAKEKQPFSLRTFDPTLVLAAVCTVAFYIVVTMPSMSGSLLAHYTTEHIVEYVIVALFFWGLIDIGHKFLTLPRELLANRQEWLPAQVGRVPASAAEGLLEDVLAKPAWLRDSRIGKRLVQALSFVKDKGSGEDYSEYLRYLSDQDHNQTQANYTLIRFVIAVTPILGFFGTVVHFGTAIGGFSLDDFNNKLSTLVAEMGTAFNTTAVALATAMTMTFLHFMCERAQRGAAAAVERFVECELANRFEVKDANLGPFLSTIQNSNKAALSAIDKSLHEQLGLWSQTLEALFEKFGERQGQESDRWQQALLELRSRHEAYDAEREKRLQKTFTVIDARQEKQMAMVQAALDRGLSFRNDLGELLKSLSQVTQGEGRLVELQSTLSNNLRLLHETRQIDSALHGLTAAIHLLTARDRQIGLHDNRNAA